MLYTLLLIVYVLACLILILFVLLQPGKADASAVFGGGANSSAFGPRGTQTVLAKVTIGAAIIFFLVAFLFAIPGLDGTGGSVGEQVPAESGAPPPAPPEPAPSEQNPGVTPAVPPPEQAAPPSAGPGATKQQSPAQSKDAGAGDSKQAPK